MASLTELVANTFLKSKINQKCTIRERNIFKLNNNLMESFHAKVHFLYYLRTQEYQWFSNVFKGYRKRPVT